MQSNDNANGHSNVQAAFIHNLKYVSFLASLAVLFLLCAARA